jgi:hypothetical protein
MFFPKENYYFKYGRYSIIVAHVVVYCKKMFIEICIGLPTSVNDSQMLHRYAWYKQIRLHGLFHTTKGCGNGILPYLLSDKGYPLINLIMTYLKKINTIIFWSYSTTKNTNEVELWLRLFLAF